MGCSQGLPDPRWALTVVPAAGDTRQTAGEPGSAPVWRSPCRRDEWERRQLWSLSPFCGSNTRQVPRSSHRGKAPEGRRLSLFRATIL